MGEEDADALQNAYGYYLQDNGVLKLRSDLTDAERTALEEAVTTPDIVLYMAAAQNANATAGDEAEAMTATPAAEDLDAVCASSQPWPRCPAFPGNDPAAAGQRHGTGRRDHPFQHGKSGHPAGQPGI